MCSLFNKVIIEGSSHHGSKRDPAHAGDDGRVGGMRGEVVFVLLHDYKLKLKQTRVHETKT